MRKFGLAAVLEFIDKGATAGMGRVGRAAASMRASFKGVSDGTSTFSRGLGNVAAVAVPVGGAFAYMMKSGVKFEQSMANLKAVALDMTKADEEALTGLAKTLGAQTKFTAAEAADGMTELSRAGFKVHEIMSAVPGVLNAAAAEGISLSTAAEMVAANVRAFALEGKDANMVAGTLALASARTNASMVSLQEGLKFAAPAARELGYDFKATVGALGALHDIGIKGTLSGTALRMALTKLVNPTKAARGALAQIGMTGQSIFKDEKGGLRPLPGVFLNLANKLRNVKDPIKRASIASKIFGIQARSLGSAFNFTEKDLERFTGTQAELTKEFGQSAKTMADLRLQSFSGQWELVSSAMEGVSIELFGMLSGFTKGGMKSAADALSNLALALRVVRGEKITDPEAVKQLKTLPPVFLEVAKGIKAGFESAKATIVSLLSSLGGVGRWLGFTGKEGAEGVARVATKFGLLLVALGPVAGVLFGVTKLLGGMVQMAWGAGRALAGAFGLAAKAIGGTLGLLTSKVPWLNSLGKGAGGLLGKAGKLVDQITAQPVRVVNWNEAGGLGGLKPGFGIPGGDAAAGAGAVARFREALNGLAGRIPLVGGLLTSSMGTLATSFGQAGLLGKLAGAGGLVAAIGAAGAAGWAFGSWLDRKFGISDKLSSWAFDSTKKQIDAVNAPAKALRDQLLWVTNSAGTLNQLIGMRERGVTSTGTAGGPKSEITREYAATRIAEGMRLQHETQANITKVLQQLAPLLAKLPSSGQPAGVTPVAAEKAGDAMVTSSGILGVSAGDVVLNRAALAAAVTSGMGGGLAGQLGAGVMGGGDPGRVSPSVGGRGGGTLRIEVPLTVDGRQLALAVAEVQLDQLERGGRIRPGERSDLLSGRLAFGEGF